MEQQDHGIFKLISLSIRHYKMFNFMCTLLFLLILYALLEDYKYAYFVVKSLSVVVFIAGIYVAGSTRKSIIILKILAIPWLFSEWFFITSTNTVFLSFFFFAYITAILLDKIIQTKDVTLDTLYAAVCIYIMLGLLWASIYGLVNQVVPGEIIFKNGNSTQPTVNEIIYFSYTTLTTLGYGDIVSLSPVGRIISVLQAIIGQLFIAFLVARLVSIFSQKSFIKK